MSGEGLGLGCKLVAHVVSIVATRDAVVNGFDEAVGPVGAGGIGSAAVPVGEGLTVAEVVAVGAGFVFGVLWVRTR